MTVTLKKANLLALIVGGILRGASAHWLLAERYRVLVVGSGSVMRVDRWSGDTWMRNQSHWDLVSVEKRVRQQDLDQAKAATAEIVAKVNAWDAGSEKALSLWRGLETWCQTNPSGGLAPLGGGITLDVHQDQMADFAKFIAGQLAFWRSIQSQTAGLR